MSTKICPPFSPYSSQSIATADNPINKIAEPFVTDFATFTNRFDEEHLGLIGKLRIFKGLAEIGDTIESDRATHDASYTNSKYALARYAVSQSAGVAAGGASLLVGALLSGPLGIATGAAGYYLGSRVAEKAFSYILKKLHVTTCE